MENEKVILGIDPGTRILGFGVIRICAGKPQLVDLGIVNLTKEGSHFLVLKRIIADVSRIIRKYKPDLMAIEGPFYGKNPQVMLKLGRAQGAAISAGLLKDIPIFEYQPRSVKLAVTGKGSASKEQVSGMVQRILNFKCTLKYLDATDALAIALCHYYEEHSLVAAAAREDANIAMSKSGICTVNVNRKGSALSMRMGKMGLGNVKSSGHKGKGGWESFVSANPGRTIESIRGGKEKKVKSVGNKK